MEVKTEGTTVNEAEIIMWKSAAWVWIVTSSLHHPNSFSAEIIIKWFYCNNYYGYGEVHKKTDLLLMRD